MIYRSLLSVNQCIKALTAAIDKDPFFFAILGSRPIVGVVRDHKFRIRKRPALYYYYNLFAPIFYGTFREELTGTLIEGHFSIHPVAIGFLILWNVGIIGLVGPFFYAIGAPVLFWVFLVRACPKIT